MRQKVEELTRGTSDSKDQEVAQELVKRELLDFYSHFDKRFFKKENQALSHRRYQVLFHRKPLQDVLRDERQVVDVPDEILESLEELVQEEMTFSRQMSKHDALNSPHKLLEAAGISELDDERQGYVSGRIQNHLYRLLLPDVYDPSLKREIRGTDPELKSMNIVCESFGKEYVQYVQSIEPPSEEDADRIRWMIGMEGADVSVFWTLAPYVHDELKREGFSKDESMAKIFDWIREGERLTKVNKDAYRLRVNLPYTRFPDGRSAHGKFVLGVDERMPTHLLARLFAKQVVEGMQSQPA